MFIIIRQLIIAALLLNFIHSDDIKSKIVTLRERAQIKDSLLKDRINTVLPQVMKRNNLDMWIIIAREYNEDPVIRTLLPATWLNARRRTILVIHDPGKNKPLETIKNNIEGTIQILKICKFNKIKKIILKELSMFKFYLFNLMVFIKINNR